VSTLVELLVFTLIELLVIIAIIAIRTLMLLRVFLKRCRRFQW
jgi:type II secretory pathway pseudopilin PulG